MSEDIQYLKQKDLDEIVRKFTDLGYDVSFNEESSVIVVSKYHQTLLTMNWINMGWHTKFEGPILHKHKDLDNVLVAVEGNESTLRDISEMWGIYKRRPLQENWEKYLGSQCPYYQKANLWGKIIDDWSKVLNEMEDLKGLALDAAKLLWKRRRSCVRSHRINQEIYELLGKIGYPTEKEK